MTTERMNRIKYVFSVALGLASAISSAREAKYSIAPNVFEEKPGGKLLGPCHGGVVLDKAGNIYVTTDTERGIVVFSPEGKFLRAFNYGEPPDGPVHFHAIGGDRWGNVYVTVRNKGNRPNEVSLIKYNNNGDFVTSWRLSRAEREVNWVTTDREGLVYAAFGSNSYAGVEAYREQ